MPSEQTEAEYGSSCPLEVRLYSAPLGVYQL